MRKMVGFTLKSAGHEVLEAADGEEAISVLQKRKADLVITDINMPKLNGIDLTRRLRSTPDYRSTPIILLTTVSDPAKKSEGRAAGATGWIVKPFDADQLLAVVSRIFPN